uniref:F-box domain-containing protein n=1 Tax=Bionectria ochroleuca TaxID=29856 RepID=A0A8H7TN14_BIOOC
MGQCCSSPRNRGEVLGKDPPVEALPQYLTLHPSVESDSPLLNLPVELYLQVSSKLDECSAASLALASRASYHLRKPLALASVSNSQPARSEFLQLLERDPNVGDRLFFCDMCTKLHPFQDHWGPDKSWGEFMSISRFGNYKHHTIGLNLLGTSVDINWYHARLAMNRHLHGFPCGIRIENLSMSTQPQIAGSRKSVHTTQARIVDDKLIVRIHHVLTPVWPDVPAETFRQDVLSWTLYVCPHTAVGSCFALRPASLPELEGRDDGGGMVFRSCRDSVSSCKRCNSDFSVTIEGGDDASGRSSGGYRITVVSYHMVGACRSPWDKDCVSLFDCYSSHLRNLRRYPRGSVIKKWYSLSE